MNILVTGSKGQLGQSIQKLSKAYHAYNFFFTDIEEVDITQKDALLSYIEENNIQVVVNTAAYTAVDKAEEEESKALAINRDAVQNLVDVCNRCSAFLIHISTDYVFNGRNYKPYREDDETVPDSAYGRSKQAGEKIIDYLADRAVIIRTSWLYSEYGHNFVKTMMKYGRERDELRVVFDQVGSPTYAGDLAQVILEMLSKLDEIRQVEIFHYSNEGVCSWYDFAREIHLKKNIACILTPIETKDYPLPAKRPPYSVLNKQKIKDFLQMPVAHWADSLEYMLKNLSEKI